jgi:hypothetical protein
VNALGRRRLRTLGRSGAVARPDPDLRGYATTPTEDGGGGLYKQY